MVYSRKIKFDDDKRIDFIVTKGINSTASITKV